MASSSSNSGGTSSFVYLLILLYLFFPGCSENSCTRHWETDQTFKLPCGEKLVNATWDGNDIVYTTRPMKPGDVAETIEMRVKANWYLVYNAGVVTIRECGNGGLEVPVTDAPGKWDATKGEFVKTEALLEE